MNICIYNILYIYIHAHNMHTHTASESSRIRNCVKARPGGAVHLRFHHAHEAPGNRRSRDLHDCLATFSKGRLVASTQMGTSMRSHSRTQDPTHTHTHTLMWLTWTWVRFFPAFGAAGLALVGSQPQLGTYHPCTPGKLARDSDKGHLFGYIWPMNSSANSIEHTSASRTVYYHSECVLGGVIIYIYIYILYIYIYIHI